MLHQLLCILVRGSDLWPGSNNDEACSLTYRQDPRWIISIDYFMACWCSFVKRERERQRGSGESKKKKKRRRRKVMGWLRRCEDFSLESLQHRGKRQNPDSFNHHSHHSTVRGKNQWLTAFNQSSALGRSIQNKGARQGGPYRSVFTHAVKHYFTARITISINQCHSLFKQGESIQYVSFVFSVLGESYSGWSKSMENRKHKWLIIYNKTTVK